VSDSDSSSSEFTVTASADSGVVNPASDTGDLAKINSDLTNNGIVYSPGGPVPVTDKVSVTVSDKSGATDTVNLIFNVSGSGPTVALQGTAGKDVIFATGHQDTLTSGAAADQFVFTSNTGGNDTITDFTPGQDKIDIHDFVPFTPGSPGSFNTWVNSGAVVQQGADTLIHLDMSDSILLSNVVKANLSAGDFVLHPGI
jgi:Ca2+-binding RTX toxin-like protein